MTLETVYYIGQTIAVVAILASLVAIYIQQRKDHAFAKAASQREILQKGSGGLDAMLEHPNALESIQRCLLDYNTASSRQKAEFALFMYKYINVAEQAHYMGKDNLIDQNSRDKFIAWPAALLNTPGGQEYWDGAKQLFGDDIAREIDRVIGELPQDIEAFFKLAPFLRADTDAEALKPEKTKRSPRKTP